MEPRVVAELSHVRVLRDPAGAEQDLGGGGSLPLGEVGRVEDGGGVADGGGDWGAGWGGVWGGDWRGGGPLGGGDARGVGRRLGELLPLGPVALEPRLLLA